jgi:hypothetical protein
MSAWPPQISKPLSEKLPLEHFQAKWIRFAVENAAKSNES